MSAHRSKPDDSHLSSSLSSSTAHPESSSLSNLIQKPKSVDLNKARRLLYPPSSDYPTIEEVIEYEPHQGLKWNNYYLTILLLSIVSSLSGWYALDRLLGWFDIDLAEMFGEDDGAEEGADAQKKSKEQKDEENLSSLS